MNQPDKSIDTLELLRREVAKIVNVESVDVNIGLAEIGIDSLNIVEMIVFCEQLYGNLDPDTLKIDQYTTLTDLDNQLKSSQTVVA